MLAINSAAYGIYCEIGAPIQAKLHCFVGIKKTKDADTFTSGETTYRLICSPDDYKLWIKRKGEKWEKKFRDNSMINEKLPKEVFGSAQVSCYSDQRTCRAGKTLCY